MRWRTIGGAIILAGVLAAVGAVAAGIAGGTARLEVGAPSWFLTVACLGLLGAGVSLIATDGPTFGGTLARRGMKTLGFGLVGDSVLYGLTALPGLHGSSVMALFIPFFVIGWATVIGAGMTLLALVTSQGHPRKVGAVFLVVPVALFVVNLFINTRSGIDDARLLAIVFGFVAGVALLLGFAGLALLAFEDQVVVATGDAAGASQRSR